MYFIQNEARVKTGRVLSSAWNPSSLIEGVGVARLGLAERGGQCTILPYEGIQSEVLSNLN